MAQNVVTKVAEFAVIGYVIASFSADVADNAMPAEASNVLKPPQSGCGISISGDDSFVSAK
jgi:hypothetical protein